MGRLEVEKALQEACASRKVQTAGDERPEGAVELVAHDTAGVNPVRRDRRMATRQNVDDWAAILLVRVGSILRGRILDLSSSGCRIRTDAHFPLGIYTRVETEFRVQGVLFRLGGVIQAIHDSNTVGIRFLDLSERKRQRVLELIDEIAALHAAKAPEDPAAA